MAISAKKTDVISVRFPVLESATPVPSCLIVLSFSTAVNVVNVECPKIIKAAYRAFAAQRFNDRHFSLPIARMLVNSGTILIPVSLLTFWRAKLRVAGTSAFTAFSATAPARRQVASLSAIFTSALLETIKVHLESFAAMLAHSFYSRFFHDMIISKYSNDSNSRYFDIAVRRIQAALDAPDMFIERPKPAKQEAFEL